VLVRGGGKREVGQLPKSVKSSHAKKDSPPPKTADNGVRRGASGERVTRRSLATRDRLMTAARKIFERDGFTDARVAEIVAQAGVGYGSFYTHFSDKLDILLELVKAADEERTRHFLTIPRDLVRDPVAALSYSNRTFLEDYMRDIRLTITVQQASVIVPEISDILVERRMAHVKQLAHTIEGWQRRNLADGGIDAAEIAAALICMRTEFAHHTFRRGADYDLSTMVDTVTHIWVCAVGLHRVPESRK
jgi:AcrR family transcriptional regulator